MPNVQVNNERGSVTASAGGNTIAFSSTGISANTTVTIKVNVTSDTDGTYASSVVELTSDAGTSTAFSRDLEVISTNRPKFSMAFNPAVVNLGDRSTLTFTIDNTVNGNEAKSLDIVNVLPKGLRVASPSNVNILCSNNNLAVVIGENNESITVSSLILGVTTISAGESCQIAVDVIATDIGTIGNLTENAFIRNQNFQVVNIGIAGATLEVNPSADILLTKNFLTDPVLPGGTIEVAYTLKNLDRRNAIHNINFTDNFDSQLTGLSIASLPNNNVCNASFSGTSSLSVTGASLGVGESCTFTVGLNIPVVVASGFYESKTSALTGTKADDTPASGTAATDKLFVQPHTILTTSFSPAVATPGDTISLTYSLQNTSQTFPATDVSFTNNLGQFINGLSITKLPDAAACGTGSLFFENLNNGILTFNMTGGTLAPGANCDFTLEFVVPDNISTGIYFNTTSKVNSTIDQEQIIGKAATSNLEIVGCPTLAMEITNNPVVPGETANLQITLSHGQNAGVAINCLLYTSPSPRD